MTTSGYGRGGGYSGHGGIDRERAAAPPPLSLPPRGAYTPTRGGFDHPNIGSRPMIPPPSASRAPYGEPIGNSSTRTYPDVGNLSLNDNRSRSQDDDFQRQNGRGGPPAPPAGRYGDPEDAGSAARPPMPRNGDDYREPLQPQRGAFGEGGRQPPVPPAAYGRGEQDRSRDGYAPAPTSQRPSGVPPPPGYVSSPAEPTNIPPPTGYNRPLDPRINAPVNPPAPRVNDRRPSPPGQRNGYDAPPQRGPYEDPRYAPQGRYEEDRRPPPSAPPQYNDREPAYNAPRGSYNASRNGYDAPAQRGYDDRNDYDNRRPAYEPAPRGYDAPPRRDYDDRYGYDDRRGPAPPRGPPMNDYRRGPPNDYDNRRQNGYSNDRDYARPSYNPAPPRGGYGAGPGYGRQQSPPNRGYNNGGYGRPEGRGGGYARSGGNDVPLGGGGNSRFANSGQNTRQFDSYNGNENGFRPTFGQKERAPRDYVPHERAVEEIFQDDKNHSVHDGAFLSQDADIEVLGSDIKVNCEKWDEMELHPKILENINKSGYLYPRKIQQYTIPYVFDNFDIMCQGETGSGKTAAFLIPTIHKFLQDKESGAWKFTNRPYCLIISPTRELANQLYLQAKKFAHGTSCVIERAYGEINVRENIKQVSKCDILIGCVGRLLHFMNGGDLQCQDIKMLIIDEADRLFGDQNDQKFFELFGWLPDRSKRQTLLFSATLQDRVIQALANDHMKPDCINIMAKNQSNSRVTYLIYAAESELKKMAMLTQFLRSTMKDGEKPRCLVFVNQKAKTDPVSIALSEEGIAATTIHGDRSQDLREEALNDFQKGKKQVLVATDVCARGVDIYDMDYVVNMDLPRDKSTYIQRCGRTGRLKEGYAVSFYYEPTDRLLAPDIAAILENSHQASPEFLHNGVRPGDCGIAEIPEREQRQNMASPSNVSAASSTSTARAASVPTPTPIHDNTIADGW